MKFPLAPSQLPSAMAEHVRQLAELWANEPSRPRVHPDVLQHWDKLIAGWAHDNTFPLFIRKAENNRGSVIAHSTGRALIPTDNSPAQWAFTLAINGVRPSLDEVRRMLNEDRIPVAMMLKTIEKPVAKYRCVLSKDTSLNIYGWKLAHINDVGIKRQVDLMNVRENSLLPHHFQKFMTPRNMFVIPLKYSGLGELAEFRAAMRSILKPS